MHPLTTVPPPDVLQLVDRVARSVGRSRHLTPEDVDDFAQTVQLRVAGNDYDILRQFEGRSSLKTYLTVVAARMLKDWQNHRYGKWRPSAASERLGPVAVTLDRLINRDAVPATEAVRTVASCTGLPEHAIEFVADRVPRRHKRQLVGLEVAEGRGVDFEDPVAAAEHDQETAATRSRLARALAGLPQEDARLMVMRFVGGHAVSDLARRHGVDAKGLYRRFERIRRDLRQRLRAGGLAGVRAN
jgi:RNA polymerase sigma factor (sigma-70 family)